jgi:hypothetical protein
VAPLYYQSYKERLKQDLAGDDQKKKVLAIKELGGMMEEEVSFQLIEILRNSPNAVLRREAAIALERIAEKNNAEALLEFLTDSEPEVSLRVAKALGYGIPPSLFERVVEKLRSGELREKTAAFLLSSLHYIEKTQSAPVIVELVKNSSSVFFRSVGCRVLRGHGTYSCLREMIEIYWSCNPNVNDVTIPLGSVIYRLLGGLEGVSEYQVARDGLPQARKEEYAQRFLAAINDGDEDGMEDNWERVQGLDPTEAGDAQLDLDGNGLTNLQEFNNKTKIRERDSDGGGVGDWEEIVIFWTNPLRGEDDRYVLLVAPEKNSFQKSVSKFFSYPNPFNPKCYLPINAKDKKQNAKCKIYNILGQLVREIECSGVNVQDSRVYWDGKDSRGLKVPSGVYFYEVARSGKKDGSAKINKKAKSKMTNQNLKNHKSQITNNKQYQIFLFG